MVPSGGLGASLATLPNFIVRFIVDFNDLDGWGGSGRGFRFFRRLTDHQSAVMNADKGVTDFFCGCMS